MRGVAYFIRIILGIAGAGVVIVAFANNAYFWHTMMAPAGDTAQKLYIGFSGLAGALKIGIPAALAIFATSFWRRKDLAFVFVIAALFDIWSGLGYWQLTREEAAREAGSTEQHRAKLETDIKDLEAKLSKVPADTRAAAVVRTSLATAEKQAGRCQTRTESRNDWCAKVFDLRDELANAEARVDTEAKLAPLRTELADMPPAKDTEPHITSVGKKLRDMGCTYCTNEALRNAWGGLMLALLELAPSALFVFVFVPPALPVRPVTLEQPKRAPRQSAAGSAPPMPRAPRRQPSAPGSADVITLLTTAQADAAGWIRSTQRAMAEALGISVAEVNRQIMDLESRNVLEKRAGRSGTALRIISHPKVASTLRAVP